MRHGEDGGGKWTCDLGGSGNSVHEAPFSDERERPRRREQQASGSMTAVVLAHGTFLSMWCREGSLQWSEKRASSQKSNTAGVDSYDAPSPSLGVLGFSRLFDEQRRRSRKT